MIKRIINLAIFMMTISCLLITIGLFLNLGIYVDEYNTSPDKILGGYFWLMMNWIKLFLLFALTCISGARLLGFGGEKKKVIIERE